ALRAALGRTMPEYMVPAAFVELAELPVTANGKLDRKALPEPVFASAGGSEPATETERGLAALYAELLGVAQIGREDDFFSLGGDSLLAVQLMIRIREVWGRDPGLAALFEYPDLAGLASRIDASVDGEVADGLGSLITLARGDEALPSLFLIHPAGGLCWGYRTLAQALAPK